MKYLIVGLGNIGSEYQNTRHNIGFKILDAFAEASNISFSTERYGDIARMRLKKQATYIVKAFHIHESERQCRTLLERQGRN